MDALKVVQERERLNEANLKISAEKEAFDDALDGLVFRNDDGVWVGSVTSCGALNLGKEKPKLTAKECMRLSKFLADTFSALAEKVESNVGK